MADIHPFRGMRYNEQMFPDLSPVICAPSDIITADIQRKLYRRSKYNFARLDTALGADTDDCEDARWRRAAATMEKWLEGGILQMDPEPAIYIHDYHFLYRGKQHTRRGITALVRLEDWDRMIVRRHEKILHNLRCSRLSQIRAMKANTSPLLAFFRDRGGHIESLLAGLKLGDPMVNSSIDIAEGRHNLWSITDPEIIERICRGLADEPLYIADGHHRYESALAYRAERRASSSSASKYDPANFTLMTLTPVSDPGLIVRPFHRLVRNIPQSAWKKLLSGLEDFFQVKELPLDRPDAWQRADDLRRHGDPAHPEDIIIMLYGLDKKKLISLRAHNLAPIVEALPASQSEAHKKLDVSIADEVIIDRLLGMSHTRDRESLAYSFDRQDAVDRVDQGEYQLAILIRATRPEQIMTIADAGETMPPKSTRFYPKPPSGFVFYRMT